MRLTLRERTATLIVKSVVLVLGIIALGFLYVVEQMGGVLAVSALLIIKHKGVEIC